MDSCISLMGDRTTVLRRARRFCGARHAISSTLLSRLTYMTAAYQSVFDSQEAPSGDALHGDTPEKGPAPKPPFQGGRLLATICLLAVGVAIGFIVATGIGRSGGEKAQAIEYVRGHEGGPSASQALQNREDEAFIRAIDAIGAEPEDPDKPDGVPGVTESQILSMSDDQVQAVLGDDVIENAIIIGEGRTFLALGRVAHFHAESETAFDLFTLAANAGSAPAYMYLVDYVDDADDVMELINQSIELGFNPAFEARERFSAWLDAPDSDRGPEIVPVEGGQAELQFGRFHQPEVLRALYDGDSALSSIVPQMPSSAPDFIANAGDVPLVNEMITKLYAYHLAVALGEMAMQENPAYLVGTPLLGEFVDANVKNSAELRLDTEEMLLIGKGVSVVKRLSAAKPILETARRILDETPSLESLPEIGGTFLEEWLEQDKRSKSAERFSRSVQEQAKLDAIAIQKIYYDGNTVDVKKIYASLQRFVIRRKAER